MSSSFEDAIATIGKSSQSMGSGMDLNGFQPTRKKADKAASDAAHETAKELKVSAAGSATDSPSPRRGRKPGPKAVERVKVGDMVGKAEPLQKYMQLNVRCSPDLYMRFRKLGLEYGAPRSDQLLSMALDALEAQGRDS